MDETPEQRTARRHRQKKHVKALMAEKGIKYTHALRLYEENLEQEYEEKKAKELLFAIFGEQPIEEESDGDTRETRHNSRLFLDEWR